MAPPTSYLAVLKASYDYEPQSEDEIAIKEDQILFLIERTDEDWWKVKTKDLDESNEGGLVPAAYVEPAEHKSVVKALYDYDASAPGEISVKEDDVLVAFDNEEDWLLVQTDKDGGKAGFVPVNYVEETTETEAAEEEEEEAEAEAPAASAIIVPPSPPRPTAPYVDPAERVAAAHARAQNDSIQTWAVAEVDKKGKKKKGTLGIGNGAIFFASESDKTPVQKWPTSDVGSSHIDKSKHVYIDIGGASPINLHFNAGSKDTAEAILEKLDASKAASMPSAGVAVEEGQEDSAPLQDSPKSKKNGASVHFATTPPSIISPRELDEGSEPEDYVSARDGRTKLDDGNEWVTVLYDFTADGDDELSVQEGDRLIVLEKDGDEWWKVQDTKGHEGVVPASYVELDEQSDAVSRGSAIGGDNEGAALRVAEQEKREEERRRERQEAERKRTDAERKAKTAAEAAEADRKRKERERERKAKEEEELRLQEEEQEDRKRASRQSRPASASGSRSRPSEDRNTSSPSRESKTRTSTDKARGAPAPQRTRTWHDRTGQFKVDAEFLGFSNGKLRLHKTNGVVIEVPAEKMSPEDMRFIDRLKAGKEKEKVAQSSRRMSPTASDDDEPLAVRRRSLQPEAKPTPPKKGKSIDWFEFFLNAGCDLDDCTRYANSFERDKIDEAILPDITQQTMRSLGLREGDIIRVTKAITQRLASSGGGNSALEEQMRKDEEVARKLQEEESGGSNTPKRATAPSPGLFAGPGGVLKNNTRRGRPQPSRSTPPATVDLHSITTASEQINRYGSPTVSLGASPTSGVSGPPRASSAAPVASGFEDDAWTNRPSSTQPLASTPTVATRAPSAPPVQTAPSQVRSPPAAPAPPPAPANSLSRTTESDVFDQLARLSALKVQSPAATSPSPASAPPNVTPPIGYQNGMGIGSSPAPISQLQSQATGFPQQNNGPRGPFAPVPANQSLLQPLVPTNTGFNSFVPTRPSSNPPPYNNPPPQPSFLATQPTGFSSSIASQPTGYPGSINAQPTGFSGPFNAQPTGYPGSFNAQPTGFSGTANSQPTGFPGAIASQPTGYQSGPMMTQTTSYPGALGTGPFAGGRSFGALQPNVTGYNPGFGQVSSPPPVPPLPTNNTNNTSPANIFAQMKSGTFGDDNAPQPSNKYDSLRPQPTGWGMQGAPTGYQNGYSGPFY
ncbi:hypothetical protein DFH11DRAFT_1883080 [Phellopilus nigrolimitatus]|nr:hypothetical protein DFH11DRAFT_1883080 [Phellopilus nigrolimitatus]